MSDDFNNNYGSPHRAGSSYARFSRSAGVAGYRRRRRQRRVFKWVAGIILVAIIGGAVVMFSQRILEMPVFAPAEPSKDQQQQASGEQDAVIPTAQPAQITLSMVGDVILQGAAYESGMKDEGGYDYTSLFANVSSEVNGSDLRLLAQETNMSGENYGYGSWDNLNAPVELGHAEVAAGFNVILHANDHALDNDTEGLHNELDWWNSSYSQMPVLGVSDPNMQDGVTVSGYANDVYVFEKDGFKVAVLNHTWNEDEEQTRFISVLSEDKIAADVRRARDAGAQMIVACPHWGDENNGEVSEDQMHFARVYADNGVDVVIGTHPRVLQRTEVLEGEDGHKTVCFYSLGCFVSSLDTNNFVGGLAEVTLSRDDTGACSVSSAVLKPVVTRRANRGEYSTYLLRDYTEELGQTGWDYLLPETVQQMCIDALGEAYNVEECQLNVV